MKDEKDVKPLHAKSLIVAPVNFEYILYQKSQRYAPVIKYSYLRLLTTKSVGYKRIVQQGDFKNSFCNTKLLDDEFTVIRPTISHPSFQDDEYWLLIITLYGLRRSLHHWYNMIKGILLKMVLNDSPHNPCLIYGVLTNPYSPACTSDL